MLLTTLSLLALTSCVESISYNKAINGNNDEGHNTYKQVQVDHESNKLEIQNTDSYNNR